MVTSALCEPNLANNSYMAASLRWSATISLKNRFSIQQTVFLENGFEMSAHEITAKIK